MFVLTLAATAYIKNNLAEVEITERERGESRQRVRQMGGWSERDWKMWLCGYADGQHQSLITFIYQNKRHKYNIPTTNTAYTTSHKMHLTTTIVVVHCTLTLTNPLNITSSFRQLLLPKDEITWNLDFSLYGRKHALYIELMCNSLYEDSKYKVTKGLLTTKIW